MAVRKSKPKISKVSEKQFQKNLVYMLRTMDVYVYRQNVVAFEIDNRFIRSGAPIGSSDLLALFPPGIAMWIECKSSTGKMRESQLRFKEEIEERGGIYYLATPKIPMKQTIQEIKDLVENKCKQIHKKVNQELLLSATATSKRTLPLKLT